jgi:thioredoxin-like negative regulator of GroEL
MAKNARPKAGHAEHKGRRLDHAQKPLRRVAANRDTVALPAKPLANPIQTHVPDPQALGLFQEALEAVHRHAFRQAADRFRQLLERFPDERAVLDRARVYLDLCERELAQNPSDPRTVEERLTGATAALNNGNEGLAAELAGSVLADVPEHDLALYLMAAVSSRRGEAQEALGYLTRAVSSSPEVRAQARHDADFEALHQLEAFQALIDAPMGSSLPLRPRRLR